MENKELKIQALKNFVQMYNYEKNKQITLLDVEDLEILSENDSDVGNCYQIYAQDQETGEVFKGYLIF